MNNSYCRKYILGFCDKIKMDDTLSHHGILGMSWGKRFGPPYPLGGVDKVVSRAEAKRKKEKEKRMAKLQKARKKAMKLKAKAAKKEAKQLEKEEKQLAKKQELIDKGDYQKILKNSNLFSNDELRYYKEQHDIHMQERLARIIDGATKAAILTKNISDIASNISNLSRVSSNNELNQLSIKEKKLDIAKKAQAMADEHAKNLKSMEVQDASIKKTNEEAKKAYWESYKTKGEAGQSIFKATDEYIGLGKSIRDDRLDAINKNRQITEASANFSSFLRSNTSDYTQTMSTPVASIPSDYTAMLRNSSGNVLSQPMKSSTYRSAVSPSNWETRSANAGSGTIFNTYEFSSPRRKTQTTKSGNSGTNTSQPDGIDDWAKSNIISAPLKDIEPSYVPKHGKTVADTLSDLAKRFSNIIL